MTFRSLRPGLARATFLAAALLSGCSPAPEKDARRPVVLILIDTLRADHLSLLGYPKPTSPGLDRLAESAVVFEHCLAPCSWTKPSTASLLSGLDPIRHEAHGTRLVAEEAEMLAERMRAAGFATGAFSGNPYVSAKFGLAQGFDTFREAGVDTPKEYPDVTELLDDARAWLARVDEGQPYFLYLHVMNVHGPYRAPPEYADRFREGPPGGSLPFQGELWQKVVDPMAKERAVPSAAEMDDLVASYDGAIAYTDEKLCAFLDELRAVPRGEDAIVVITSDHGEELMDHGGLGHRRTLYGEVINVPLLVQDRENARRVDAPVGLIDVAATVLDLSGAEPVDAFGDGISLAPLVRGEPAVPREVPLMAHLQEGPAGTVELVQSWPWRLLWIGKEYTRRRNVVELFDVMADPDERNNVAREHPDVVQRLDAVGGEARAWLEARSLGSGDDAAMDSALRERLEALGYTGN